MYKSEVNSTDKNIYTLLLFTESAAFESWHHGINCWMNPTNKLPNYKVTRAIMEQLVPNWYNSSSLNKYRPYCSPYLTGKTASFDRTLQIFALFLFQPLYVLSTVDVVIAIICNAVSRFTVLWPWCLLISAGCLNTQKSNSCGTTNEGRTP